MALRSNRVRSYAGWTQTSPGRGSKGATWTHDASGWKATHCGGFSATVPYYLTGPTDPRPIFSFNGRGFSNLEAAMTVVRAIVERGAVVTDDRCEVGILRTPMWTSLGFELDQRDPRDWW